LTTYTCNVTETCFSPTLADFHFLKLSLFNKLSAG